MTGYFSIILFTSLFLCSTHHQLTEALKCHSCTLRSDGSCNQSRTETHCPHRVTSCATITAVTGDITTKVKTCLDLTPCQIRELGIFVGECTKFTGKNINEANDVCGIGTTEDSDGDDGNNGFETVDTRMSKEFFGPRDSHLLTELSLNSPHLLPESYQYEYCTCVTDLCNGKSAGSIRTECRKLTMVITILFIFVKAVSVL